MGYKMQNKMKNCEEIAPRQILSPNNQMLGIPRNVAYASRRRLSQRPSPRCFPKTPKVNIFVKPRNAIIGGGE